MVCLVCVVVVVLQLAVGVRGVCWLLMLLLRDYFCCAEVIRCGVYCVPLSCGVMVGLLFLYVCCRVCVCVCACVRCVASPLMVTVCAACNGGTLAFCGAGLLVASFSF